MLAPGVFVCYQSIGLPVQGMKRMGDLESLCFMFA